VRKVKIGILGCGDISHAYIQNIQKIYTELEITACSNHHFEKAKEVAGKYGIEKVLTLDEMLADGQIEIIVNLTPPLLHSELNRKILEAGKHVFSEKPFALTVEDALSLMELAKEKHLSIGCAPDTFLGAGLKTADKLLDEGAIGTPLYVTANMISAGPETWHPNPVFFYKEGGGPLYDVGPYYLTAIVAMLGPIEQVCALSSTGFLQRDIYSGKLKKSKIQVEIPTHYAGILRLKSGVIVSLNFSFDVFKSSLPKLEIYGTQGTMILPDPNTTSGCTRIYRKEQYLRDSGINEEDIETEPDYIRNLLSNPKVTKLEDQSLEISELYPVHGEYVRGTGVYDMAQFITGEKADYFASAKLAVHVVEAMNAMVISARTGINYQMKTII